MERDAIDSIRIDDVINDPYSIDDTSGGDPRLFAVRRIALASIALGIKADAVEKVAVSIAKHASTLDNAYPCASELTVADLNLIAASLEATLDSLMYD
jgi:hypothetical protein